jgi:pimeloyl-ACP methyl ester carboxylesterase
MGSLIAFRTAVTHPSKVDGIIAMSSISRPSTQPVIDAFNQFYAGWVSTPIPSEKLMNLAIYGWGDQTLDVNSNRCKIIKRDWAERMNRDSQVGVISDSVMNRDGFVDELKGIKVPVLLVQGEKDITWSVEEAEIERDVLPNAELKVVSGSGHMLIFARKSDDVNGFIEEFLQKCGY